MRRRDKYTYRVNAKLDGEATTALFDIRKLAGTKDISEAVRLALMSYASELRLTRPLLPFVIDPLSPPVAGGYDQGDVAKPDPPVSDGVTAAADVGPDNVEAPKGKRRAKHSAKPATPSDNNRPKKGGKDGGQRRKHDAPAKRAKGAKPSQQEKAPARRARKSPV